MLEISREEWNKIVANQVSKFCSSAASILRSTHPAASAKLNDEELAAFVEGSVKLGRRFGIQHNGEMLDWLQLLLEMGESFYMDPDYAWTRKILEGAQPGKIKRIRRGLRPRRDFQEATEQDPLFGTPPGTPPFIAGSAVGDPVVRCNPPVDCAELWDPIITKVDAISNIEDPIERNEKISAAYAQLYLENKELKWAGLAAFVSKQVGCVLRRPSVRLTQTYGEILDFFGDEPVRDSIQDILGEGNKAVFKSAYPALSFYATNKKIVPPDQIRECLNNTPPNHSIHDEVIFAVGLFQSGDFFQATEKLIMHEQHGPVEEKVFTEEPIRRLSRMNRQSFHMLADYGIHFSSYCKTLSAHEIKFGSNYRPIENPKRRFAFGISLLEAFIDAERRKPEYLKRELGKIKNVVVLKERQGDEKR